MTNPAVTVQATVDAVALHHPYRWKMSRAGLLNVWYYYDTTFHFSGGRLVLRGTNGSGKSRALEMLLPFLIDADRRKMDATGSGKVRLQDLMKAGSIQSGSRGGYLWLELVRNLSDEEFPHGGKEYLTLGAYVRYSQSTGEVKVWYFNTPLRVGNGLQLMSASREVLPREQLTSLVGADRVTESPEAHRDQVRSLVYGLSGEAGRERFAGLLQLTHTLRSPDVGNRIEEGRLPQILSDALPPLSEVALNAAGEQLDGLSETRSGQERLDQAYERVMTFLGTYRRYAAGVLSSVANAAQSAVATAASAAQKAELHRKEYQELIVRKKRTQTDRALLSARVGDLEGTIAGYKDSKAYMDARELEDRASKLAALARSADSALTAAHAARQTERSNAEEVTALGHDAADDAGDVAQALDAARQRLHAAGAPTNIAETARVQILPTVEAADLVRTRRGGDPDQIARPVLAALDVTPSDIPESQAQLSLVAQATRRRRQHAEMRAVQARVLDKQEALVNNADRRTEDALAEAEAADDEASAADALHSDELNALALQWQEWVASPETVAALRNLHVEGGPVADMLSDLSSGVSEPDLLERLDQVPHRAAVRVRDLQAGELALLNTAELGDQDLVRVLKREQGELRAAVDPAPPAPTWIGIAPEDAIPLWQAVDFAEGLPEQERAGIESALLASGLLLGAVTADGTLRAGDGQLLLHSTGPAAASPLSRVLIVDSNVRNQAAVGAILDQIGYGADTNSTWVAADGAWRNGPLTGRLTSATAHHIGSVAREAARKRRLEAIDSELTALDAAAADRAQARDRIRMERARLEEAIAQAPRSQPVVTAKALATDADLRARRYRVAAREASDAAQKLRHEWTLARTAHEEACSAFSLPTQADALLHIQGECGEAARLCDAAASAFGRLSKRLEQHSTSAARFAIQTLARQEAEAHAAREWHDWHTNASEFEALRASVGADVDLVRRQLTEAEDQLSSTRDELDATRELETTLSADVGRAETLADLARVQSEVAHRELFEAAASLKQHLDLPGISVAGLDKPLKSWALADVTGKALRSAAEAVLANLHPGNTADQSALMRAQQILEREVSGTYDVISENLQGVWLVELADASGRRTITDAAAELGRRREEGKAALSERERIVFTDFVIGGVADELRRRLDQAANLLEAMNVSLASIRTSHGIGVKLRWNLTESAGPLVLRIRELVTTAAALRTTDATAELTDLLKQRVDESFARDATAGYAEHLRNALDYRSWHAVEVLILGPAPGQQRRLTRGARLSQGETRFVSYVTLFAAVDAYLSGLPASAQALRLLLLDDAFAKVDDPTIAELMGLLVRLDIDFAMTGHALWGTYPQVPALDCYEVRRRQDGPAVTTHVHWDGRNRHLRAAQ